MTAPLATRCRVLIGGFGAPSQRDLDFGRQVITYLEPFSWPEGVVVEDLSFSAHLVLHRMQELRPAKLVLVGAAARGTDRPGSVRRRRVDNCVPAAAKEVQDALSASVGGAVDVDHTLSVLRHWGGLPPETVLIEVEAADCSFGLGFSEELAPCFDTILDLVRAELDAVSAEPDSSDVADPPVRWSSRDGSGRAAPMGQPGTLATLVEFAERRKQARIDDRSRGGNLVELPDHFGVEVAARSRPWGMGLQGGGDWFDAVPLDDDWVGVVIGDVPGRGMDAVPLKADLRMAAQAYLAVDGRSPARVVEQLDRFVTVTGRGAQTTVAAIALRPRTGEVRMCSAGHCPPLVVHDGRGRFLHDDFTPPVGAENAGRRMQIDTRVEPGATVLLFTDGLLARPDQPLAFGLLQMMEAAASGPGALEALCDNVVAACLNRHRREDDASLLALRLPLIA